MTGSHGDGADDDPPAFDDDGMGMDDLETLPGPGGLSPGGRRPPAQEDLETLPDAGETGRPASESDLETLPDGGAPGSGPFDDDLETLAPRRARPGESVPELGSEAEISGTRAGLADRATGDFADDDYLDMESMAPRSHPAPGAPEGSQADVKTIVEGPPPDVSDLDLDLMDDVPKARERGTHVGGADTASPGDSQEDMETMLDSGTGTQEVRGTAVEQRRQEGTVAGSFAPTQMPSKAGSEGETVFDPTFEKSMEASTKDARPKSKRTQRTRSELGGGTAKGAKTARAPFAGGTEATAAGSGGGGHVGPTILKVGELLSGRYELVKQLGVGGMGEVWLARHTLLQGMRAIKLIKATISRDPNFRARFLSEGQTMMRIKHPAVVEVTDLDETRGNRELFMVMEALKGRTLYDAIRDEENPICNDPRNVARIYKEIAIGMQRINDERIVHKDLKSDNVLLVKGEDGLEHPKIIDFGLAKTIEQSDGKVEDTYDGDESGYDPDLKTTLSGTLAYMAPEQFMGTPSSFQSDIYAWAVMLYEAFLKGDYPIPRGGLTHYLRIHKDGVKPLSLATKCDACPPEIAAIADKGMSVAKDDRPDSFQECADGLQWWLDAPVRAARRREQIKLYSAFAALILIAVLVWAFAGETVATLTGSQLESAAGALPVHQQKTYLNSDSLGSVIYTAKRGDGTFAPSLEVDGEARDLDGDTEDDTYTAKLDLSGLSDGKHELAFIAAAGANPDPITVVVDTTAPVISNAALASSPDNFFTNASAPSAQVFVDDANIAAVEATIVGGKPSVAKLVGGAWILPLPLDKPGDATAIITVTDLAGNETSQELKFHWDQARPTVSVEGLLDRDGRTVLQVRTPAGAAMQLDVGEAAQVQVSAGGKSLLDEATDGKKRVSVSLPTLADRLTVDVKLTDRAGNETDQRFDVLHVTDEATLSGESAVIRPNDELKLDLHRTYPLGATRPGLTARQVRDGTGASASGAPKAVAGVSWSATGLFDGTFRLPAGTLKAGTYELRATGLDPADLRPFSVTVDGDAPQMTFTVREAGGRDLSPDTWTQQRKVTVEVAARDLSDVTARLKGMAPSATRASGGRTIFTFEDVDCELGVNDWTLLVTDAANNAAESPIKVQADWVKPTLTNVRLGTKPAAGWNNKEPVVFLGQSSEAPITLVIEGSAVRSGGGEQAVDQSNFRSALTIDAGASQSVTLYARDPAGNESVRKTLQVEVLTLETARPDWFDYSKGALSARMRRLDKGSVTLGTRTLTVAEVYIDETEVTNAQYRVFLDAVAGRASNSWSHADQPTGHSHIPPAATWSDPAWNGADQPVVNITWWDAYAFAKWSGGRLPKETEWFKAAVLADGETYMRHWPSIPGDQSFGAKGDPRHPVTAELTGGLGTVGVSDAAYGDVSPIGCRHMGGNVSEWVDLYEPPKGELESAVRGGNFYFGKASADILAVDAKPYARSFRAKTIGFRCVRTPEALNL